MEKQLSAIAADFIETCRRADRKTFLEQMRQVHPSYQQVFAGLVLAWLNDYVDKRFDERTHASMTYVRELRDIYRAATGDDGFKDRFPFI